VSGITPVPCQFVPVIGLIERANGMAMCTAGLIGNGLVGWAPPPVVSPINSARPSACSV